jgi:hypothetical protein
MSITLDVIQPHETWDVVDPSKLTEYMRCPRKYFYRYILGWESEYPNNDLIFGSAWHLAAEHLLLEGYTPEALYTASQLFVEHYRKHFDPSTDGLLEPKNPATGLRALEAYCFEFQSDKRKYLVLHTEIGGIVSITTDHNLYFKMDAILLDKESNKILFLDHKTSKRKDYDWGEHWIMSTQMLTYTHVLNCLYPMEEVEGGKIRCTFLYKPKKGENVGHGEFDEAIIQKSPSQMNAWMAKTIHWMDLLQQDKEWLLEEDTPERSVMESFPMNDTACFAFGRKCTYFDLCNSYGNPLQRCEAPPIGMKTSFWDPRSNETIRERVDLR